jgi:hypothetical protein
MGLRVKFTDNQIKEIVEARRSGMTSNQVAAALGISDVTVRKYSPPELAPLSKTYDAAFKTKVLVAIAQGTTVLAASKEFGPSTTSIKLWIKEARRQGKFPLTKTVLSAVKPLQEIVEANHRETVRAELPASVPELYAAAAAAPRPKMALVDFINCLRELVTEYDKTKAELIRLKAEVEVWQKLKAQSDDALMNVGRR